MKRWILFALAALTAIPALSQTTCTRRDDNVTNALGQAVPNIAVTYYLQGTPNTLATVYNSTTCTPVQGIGNPQYTNGLGLATAYLVPGLYTITYSGAQIQTQTFTDQSIGQGGGGGGLPTGCTSPGAGQLLCSVSVGAGGPITGHKFILQPHTAPLADWTWDVYSQGTACAGIGCFSSMVYTVGAAPNQYALPSQAVAAACAAGGGYVFIPPGAYTDNVYINCSNLVIQGAGRQVTTINPNTSACVVTLDAGTSGTGINYDTISDLSISNTAGYAGSGNNGLCFLGGVAFQTNDNHTFKNLAINGFANGVYGESRMIWDTFDNLDVENNTNDGYYFPCNGQVMNRDTWTEGKTKGNTKYGLFLCNNNAQPDQGLKFSGFNVENNGTSVAFAECAGIWLGGGTGNQGGIGSGEISGGSYFEANCTASTDGHGADIRLSGEYVQAFNVSGNVIWSQNSYGIYNDALQTTGEYFANNISNKSAATVTVNNASGNQFSAIRVGCNFGNGATFANPLDGFASTHMESTCPDSTIVFSAGGSGGFNPITSTAPGTNNTLNPGVSSQLEVYNGPWTINTITGGSFGRNLCITSEAGSLTLATGGVSPNDILLMNSASSEVVPAGGTACFEYSAYSSQWLEKSVSHFSTSGSTAFNNLTGGTNTTAAMVVGTGATLARSGSGSIDASTVTSLAPAGAGAGLTTGPTSSTTNDLAKFTGTAGQLADALIALAGSGAAVPTGPSSSTDQDLIIYTGTAGQQADSGKKLTGAGAAVPTGPSSSTTSDLVCYTGTSAQQADCGKKLTGSGAAVPTGPTSTTDGDVIVASGTAGQIKDSGSPPAGVLLAHFESATNLAANVSATAIANGGWISGTNTIPATGEYQICMEVKTTQAATTSSTVPTVTALFTSGIDSVANIQMNLSGAGFNSTNNSTVDGNGACGVYYIASGSTIQYKTSAYASSGATPMQYAFRIRVYTAN